MRQAIPSWVWMTGTGLGILSIVDGNALYPFDLGGLGGILACGFACSAGVFLVNRLRRR